MDINKEIDELLESDDLSVDDIIKDAVKGNKKVKENSVKSIDYGKYLTEKDCLVLDLDEFKEALRIAKSISPLNELANFMSFKVENDKLFIYVTNVSEYIKTSIPVKKKLGMDGEFFSLPIDILIKAFRSSRDAIAIFKDGDKYRLSVFGGSIPIENNSGVNEEVYLKGLNINSGADRDELNIEEYREIVSSMAGLASSAVALQQKTIVLEDGIAKNSLIRCYTRKNINSKANLVMRIMDISILNILSSKEKGQIDIIRDGNKLLYKVGEHLYSCLEAKSYINKSFEESMLKATNENSSVYELYLDDLRMVTNLLVSLKNAKDYVYIKGNDNGITVETIIDNEENVFEIPGRKSNNFSVNEKIKLETAILNSVISNYGDATNVMINEECLILESVNKKSYLGVEII